MEMPAKVDELVKIAELETDDHEEMDGHEDRSNLVDEEKVGDKKEDEPMQAGLKKNEQEVMRERQEEGRAVRAQPDHVKVEERNLH